MKKLSLLLVSALVIASAQAAHAQLAFKDRESVDVTVTFGAKPGATNAITLHTAKTGGSTLTAIDVSGTQYTANTDKRVILKDTLLRNIYFQADPAGFYDVSIYTANVDPDLNHDLEWENDADRIVTGVTVHGNQLLVPLSWIETDPAKQPKLSDKANWPSLYGGLLHANFAHFLPIKVWSQGWYGGNPTPIETTTYDGTNLILSDVTNGYIATDAWTGDGAAFRFIPESVAVDTALYTSAELNDRSLADPDWGTARTTVASTIDGSKITERLNLVLGVDLLTVGKGSYNGDIYLELRSN
ncbi:MAG: hypothetical protein AB1454_10255 [Candidatus Auribacterota bacterium]